MATAKPPISPDVAGVIGEYAESVENRSLLLDKFVLHKSWPMVFLNSTHPPMRMDDASRWSFIRMAQNGDDFLQREIVNCDRAANGRNANEENREKARVKAGILRCLRPCACRRLPGSLSSQKLLQNRQFVQALSRRPGLTAVVYGELQGRLIVNLSDSLIQNAGICLDRNTGLPYIPGSAVKGVARHVALARLRNGEWSIEDFMKGFGSSEADFKAEGELEKFAGSVLEEERTLKGGIDFLAAIPITEPTIVVDISNVHYPKYYQTGDVSDLKEESPKPNTFPAVEKGVRYAFCIAANGMDGIDEDLFKKVREVLVEAITVSGIGAKTGAGYGWFKDVTKEIEGVAEQEESKRVERERIAAEEERLRQEEAIRRQSLSPEQREAEDKNTMVKKLQALPDQEFAEFAKALGEKSRLEILAFCELLKGGKKDRWKTWKKKKPDLADLIRKAVETVGVELL